MQRCRIWIKIGNRGVIRPRRVCNRLLQGLLRRYAPDRMNKGGGVKITGGGWGEDAGGKAVGMGQGGKGMAGGCWMWIG